MPRSWEGELAVPQGPGSARAPPAPRLPSAELGLLSSVCSFSSFSRFSEVHARDSSCCRMVGQNSLNSLCPTAEPSLRLWMAKSSTELKHCGREETGMCLEAPAALQRGSGGLQSPLPYPGDVGALLRRLRGVGVSHSHVQVVQQGLELPQAQGFALAVPLEEILQEGGCGERRSRAIPARPGPQAGEKAEQHEQAAAPGACAGDHGVSGTLEEKPRAAVSFSISDHRSSTPQLQREPADFLPGGTQC